MNVTVRFREVKATAKRTGKCPHCSRRVTRSRSFTQTVSPFNKNADGTPKTWAEVRQAVDAEAARWDPPAFAFVHYTCAPEEASADA